MKREEQIEKLVSYFQAGEEEEGKIGIEVEHFVIHADSLAAVNYDDDFGISDILHEFQKEGIEKHEEGEHLLSLTAAEFDITLEPGGQLEVGIKPQTNVAKLKEIYFDFIARLVPILRKRDYLLVTLGYQPQSQIKEISWLPKYRYKVMANYLGKQGKYAHNMMKGTAAFQVALDYESEIDFVNKFRVATVLTPVLSILCDNAPFFEGEIFSEEALRTIIWNNTDNSRAGIIPDVFSSDFGYRSYANYILGQELILLKTDGEYSATDQRTVEEIFKEEELGQEEIEHILTMVFPDVRAKNFIEIRMTDSVPPKCFLALAAFWKSIFYNQENLAKALEFSEDFTMTDILQAKEDIVELGLKAQFGDYTILEVAKKFLTWARDGLKDEEKNYLRPLEEIVEKEVTLAQQIKNKAKEKGKEKVLREYSLNSLIKK